MRILVPAKETAIVEDEFSISDNQIDDKYLSYGLNEWDNFAIEEAIQIEENAKDEIEVVAVSIGPERSDETIRQALAKGADRAVRIWDDELAEADMLDIETKAGILAAVSEQENPDLILTGVQSGDDLWGGDGRRSRSETWLPMDGSREPT
jgi:electron transfer flavoprotein beta subunit